MTKSAAKQKLIQPLIERLIAPSRLLEGANADMAFNPALAEALALNPAATALLSGMRLPMAVELGKARALPRFVPRHAALFTGAFAAAKTAWRRGALGARGGVLLAEAGGSPSRQNAALAAATRHGAALIARCPSSCVRT